MKVKDWKGYDAGLPWVSKPEEIGFSKTLLDKRLDNWLESLVKGDDMAYNLPNASALVSRKGKICYYKGIGNKNEKEEIKNDTLYRIYSMTKPITCIALLMLWEEGKFLLDDPLWLYLGEKWKKKNLNVVEEGMELKDAIPSKKAITIRNLFTHTSGLSYGFEGWDLHNKVDKLYQKLERKSRKENMSLADFVDELSKLPLVHQPGEKWCYSYSIDVIGRLVEVISGQSLEIFLKKRIFEPLSMFDTCFRLNNDEINSRFANIHLFHPKLGEKPTDVTKVQLKNLDFTTEKKLESGGGGLISTMRDYSRFCQCCLNKGELDGKRIIGRKTFELATMNNLENNAEGYSMSTKTSKDILYRGTGFGLGFAINLNSIDSKTSMTSGVYYWAGAASTLFFCDPKEQMFAIFFTQLLNNDDMKLPLRKMFTNLVYGCLTHDDETHENSASSKL